MKVIKYRCDRCFKDISENNMFNLTLSDSHEEYESLEMELCFQCARNITQYLGVHLTIPEELPFD